MKQSSSPANVIALHRIDIDTPCTASWANMKGDDRVRHCGDCNKNVFNLSAMPEAEAAALLAGNVDGELCVRFFRRKDGTVMTSDCSTSVRAATRRTLRKLPAVAGAAMMAMSVGAAAADGPKPPAPPVEVHEAMPTMGAPPAVQAEPPAATPTVLPPTLMGRIQIAPKAPEKAVVKPSR
jgi:hypothetical protein